MNERESRCTRCLCDNVCDSMRVLQCVFSYLCFTLSVFFLFPLYSVCLSYPPFRPPSFLPSSCPLHSVMSICCFYFVAVHIWKYYVSHRKRMDTHYTHEQAAVCVCVCARGFGSAVDHIMFLLRYYWLLCIHRRLEQTVVSNARLVVDRAPTASNNRQSATHAGTCAPQCKAITLRAVCADSNI